jgi:hypothetical protein
MASVHVCFRTNEKDADGRDKPRDSSAMTFEKWLKTGIRSKVPDADVFNQ